MRPRLRSLIPLALVAACIPLATAPRAALRPLLFGGDLSALARIEQAGGRFYDGDRETSAIDAMQAHGANLVRLRLFLAPNGDEVQVNDLAYTIALAKRVKRSGAQFLLDFHYSDTWADPQHQIVPAAWAALDIDALEDTVEAYTARVMDTLRREGVLPRIVEVGNEIDAGFMWPLGRLGLSTQDDSTQHANFGRLLRAGVAGVRRATTPADSVRVMVHFSQGASTPRSHWFYDLVRAQGVEFDIIGFSYYPWWHGSIEELRANLRATEARYGKDIMVVETAYPWTDGWTPDGPVQGTMIWPRTRDGQRAFLQDVTDAVRAIPNARGIGVVWWYPEAIRVPGLPVWGGGSLALFDDRGRITPAADVFRQVNATR